MKMRTALSFLLIASCAPPAPVDNRVADAAAITALDEQWSAAAARRDLAATVAFYADDAVLLPANAPIATGCEVDSRVLGRVAWALKRRVMEGDEG